MRISIGTKRKNSVTTAFCEQMQAAQAKAPAGVDSAKHACEHATSMTYGVRCNNIAKCLAQQKSKKTEGKLSGVRLCLALLADEAY